MFGIPADTALAWANIISLSGLAIAAAGAFAAYQLSGRINAAHGLELQQVKSEARTEIENAASQVRTRTAQLVEVNESLQLDLQSEKDARKALSAQLQRRDMTDDQMAKFVATIKGKVRQINLFTVADREASKFGLTILDALREADVAVTWYRLRSVPPYVQGIVDSGVTIYAYPAEGKSDERVTRVLAQAFTALDVQPNLLIPSKPLWDLPSPSLIIAPRSPKFVRPSQDPIPSATKSAALSDLFSHAE
jgi:transcriptional regulator NrdR family protein